MLAKVSIPGTGLSVSAVCYGTNQFGTAVPQGQADELLDDFVARGGNFIDTARSYGDWVPTAPKGASERTIGAWLGKRSRRGLVIATKGGHVDLRSGTWAPRANPRDIATDLTESQGHLGIDKIDLYWLHADDPSQPVGRLIDALIEHQKAGRIAHFGASNWTPARITEAQAYAQSIGHPGFVAVQPFWGLAVPNPEAAAAQGYQLYYDQGFEPLHAQGMPMIPYSGQSRGFFSKLAAGGETGVPEHLAQVYLNDTNRRRAKAVNAIAARRGVSVNEVVLAYLIRQPRLTIPIIGAFRHEQLAESVKAAEVALTPEELQQLRA